MPRTARASAADICYHVLNRGNAKVAVFHDEDDYRAFVRLIAAAGERVPVRVAGYCVMPNHFHLVVWPRADGDLGRWMQWLMTSHVRRHHRRYGTDGHLWQGRFKSFPIQKDGHLLTVLRYVERNPLRAGLVRKASEWRWSSLAGMVSEEAPARRCPVSLPADWADHVDRGDEPDELAVLRNSVNRGTPFGGPRWVRATAARLGLGATLRPRGRPRKEPKK